MSAGLKLQLLAMLAALTPAALAQGQESAGTSRLEEHLELGLRVGWGLNEQSAHFFSNAGFVWRF